MQNSVMETTIAARATRIVTRPSVNMMPRFAVAQDGPARRDIIEKLLILTDINGLLFGGRVLILKKTQEVITMKDVVDKCSTKGCAIDVGTIIDNEDCVYRAEKVFPSREEAESTVAAVRERAAAAAPASEPPQVDYTIVAAGDAVKLDLSIAFSCRAEKIIFELSLRNLL